MILDLARVRYIAVAGVTVLERLERELVSVGASLALTNATPLTRQVLAALRMAYRWDRLRPTARFDEAGAR